MRIFVGCSSSENINSKYLDESYLLLKEILKDNDLVYGAYNKGIMNKAYTVAHNNNQNIIAITTDKYKSELDNIDCKYKICTDNIYRRSEELIKQSDIVIILPGGIGTITELIAAIETTRNGEFNKPILIYNMERFFDKFIEFLDKIYQEKFSSVDDKKYYMVFNNKADIIRYVYDYKADINE